MQMGLGDLLCMAALGVAIWVRLQLGKWMGFK